MTTSNRPSQFEINAAARFIAYTESLKHKQSFKYVKHLKPSDRTLLNILYTSAKNGQLATKITVKEGAAFGLNLTHDMMFVGDITATDHRPMAVPFMSATEYNS